MKLVEDVRKGWRILWRRLHEQGLWVTLQWVWGRGLSYITGVPLLRYSRVTPQLYVGPQFNARGKRHLEQEGVTAVVNLRTEFDDAAHGLAFPQYCYLPTIDDDSPSSEHFQQGVDFIHSVIEEGGKVYIHCKAGVGRAPTLAAAYLISRGYSLDAALALIERARPFIAITPPQMEALRRYERERVGE
jgi:protein tyrosine phosphatase (PTP) superfamily phosphohydrolase (DUF442 family)